MKENYLSQLDEHIAVMNMSRSLADQVAKVGQRWIDALKSGGKILLMGNGGSAADAQHIAAELVGRYLVERKGLPSIALTTDTSILTAVGNDYGYEAIFSRQVEALARPQDIVVGYSTSGNSANVCAAMSVAREIGCYTVALTGESGGKLLALVDDCIRVPSPSTPRIQEVHAFVGHMLCAMVDDAFTPEAV
ncbi:Phosphoheptose isomerase 1 [gamma proteobacterium IMCC1989]|nr:Phosphoheptose isomerase 1 [gamma proteobacterium IMCC1989]